MLILQFDWISCKNKHQNYLYPVNDLVVFECNHQHSNTNRRKFEKFLLIFWKSSGWKLWPFSIISNILRVKFFVSINIRMFINFIKSVHSTKKLERKLFQNHITHFFFSEYEFYRNAYHIETVNIKYMSKAQMSNVIIQWKIPRYKNHYSFRMNIFKVEIE